MSSFLVPVVTQDAVWEVGQRQMRRNKHVAVAGKTALSDAKATLCRDVSELGLSPERTSCF
jgi:hypothetical protein